MKDDFKINLNCLNDTQELAKKIAKVIKPNTFISLRGKLGVGKTTLVSYIINSLSQKKIKVLSPTFSIVNIYNLKSIRIWHYDLYRLNDKTEIFNLDYELALMECVIVEWPEIISEYLPRKRIDILINEDENFIRNVTVKRIGKI